MGRQNQRLKAVQFSDNLRSLIQHEGWTQHEAAKQFGLDYIALRKYLNDGLANVTETNRPRLERICKKLGVSEIDFLWAPNLKPRRRTLIFNDAEAESVIFQLRQLLVDDYRDSKAVVKICSAVESAFNELVCKIKEPKEKARGGSFVDRDSCRTIVRKNRKVGGRKKQQEDG